MRRTMKSFLMRFLGRAAAVAACAPLILLLAKTMAVPVHAGPGEEIKSHTRDAAHDIAAGTRGAAHEIGEGTREAAREIADGTRDARHQIAAGAKRVKVTVQHEAHSAASAIKRGAEQLTH